MMQPCNKCPEWAQWRAQKPRFDKDGNLVSLELIAMLCGTHKQEQEKMPENQTLRFDFIGAAPMVN